MTAVTPGREELADRLQRAVDKAGTEWAYHALITEAISALRLAAKPDDDGWQDISTAPDNHLPVQVYGPYGQIVAFRDVTWAWWPIPAINPLGYNLTHWRPLPTPPATDASTKGDRNGA